MKDVLILQKSQTANLIFTEFKKILFKIYCKLFNLIKLINSFVNRLLKEFIFLNINILLFNKFT